MGIAVLILGETGSGKSASLRNFGENDVRVLNVASKPFPFKKKLKKANNVRYPEIKGALNSNQSLSYVIDDSQYLMAFDSFDRINEVGYAKFSSMAFSFQDLIRYVNNDTSADTIVYFLHHTETNEETGKIKAKTLGKMLDSQLTMEGLFSIVLLSNTDGETYWFETTTTGLTPSKTPMEMFTDKKIDNDLKIVDDTIREYYELKKNVANTTKKVKE